MGQYKLLAEGLRKTSVQMRLRRSKVGRHLLMILRRSVKGEESGLKKSKKLKVLLERMLKNFRQVFWEEEIKGLQAAINREHQRTIVYAGAIMHELGHTLGIFNSNTPGCDNKNSGMFKGEWLKYIRYKSCMNYHYTYYFVDYSDGSNGKNDFDDWGRLDLTYFQR